MALALLSHIKLGSLHALLSSRRRLAHQLRQCVSKRAKCDKNGISYGQELGENGYANWRQLECVCVLDWLIACGSIWVVFGVRLAFVVRVVSCVFVCFVFCEKEWCFAKD
jgi:hypothetical protein